MGKTLIISRREAKELLTFKETIQAMKEVFSAVSEGSALMLQRSMIRHENGNILAVMPASIKNKEITGAKAIIFPGEKISKTRTNQGIFPIFSIETGALLAITDAEEMTVVRTAAASAAATDELALKEASTLCILGTGHQGMAHVKAISLVRNIKEIYLWNKNNESGMKAAEYLKKNFNAEVKYFKDASEAVRNADIICTTSKAHEPILFGKDIKEGAHINAVGACSGKIREADTETLLKSRVFSDKTEACLKDAGDIVIPLEQGEITKDIIIGEIGEVISGKMKGRINPKDITLFESVGLGVQDLASAWLIYEKALSLGYGTEVEI